MVRVLTMEMEIKYEQTVFDVQNGNSVSYVEKGSSEGVGST
jgi:hypothetical protein